MRKVTLKYRFSVLLFLMLFLVSCQSDTDKSQAETVVEVQNCNIFSIWEFDSFLGLNYGAEERELQFSLGEPTSGYFADDSAAFIYHFNRVDRVPLSVWVNAETGKVITIFMEVVSLGENFSEDLDRAKAEFKMEECDASWFGLSVEEVKERMGEPAEEAVSSDRVTLLSYDSADFLYTVAFKFYPQQDYKCSSVSVNWFYSD